MQLSFFLQLHSHKASSLSHRGLLISKNIKLVSRKQGRAAGRSNTRPYWRKQQSIWQSVSAGCLEAVAPVDWQRRLCVSFTH